MDLQLICEQVCNISRDVGDFIYDQVNKINNDDIETKGIHDFVTYVDKTSEEKIVKELSKILPKAGYIAEENTVSKKSKHLNWIIDPLDGTTNFIHSQPCYSISIALMQDDEIIMGVVYEINLHECFYAWKDSDSFLNGSKIKVSERKKLSDSLLATGFPYYDYSKLEQYMELLKYTIKNTHGIRRLGSAAVDLCYVACGRFEGFYEYGLRPWDVAAGSFIVKQARGKVCDFNGKNNYLFGKEIIASNSNIYNELVNIIQKYFD